MVVAYNEEWKELLTGQVEKESWSKFVLNNAKQDVDRVTAAKAKKATEKKLETYKKISKSLRLQFSTNKRKG
jgi:RPA family protein